MGNKNDTLRSCTHSGSSNNEWWMAEFVEKFAVSKVVLYNRINCCPARINGVKV